MSHKPQIRIVKGGRRAAAAAPPEGRAAREKDAPRAVAENVSSWVEEFHERRATDAGRTFDSLFTDGAGS